jgi:hypothetical protein
LLAGIGQQPCDFDDPHQSWDLRDTGEIVNVADGRCLDPLQPDVKRSEIVTATCNGNISQRWFF